MNQPVSPAGEVRQVTFFAIAAPGVDPATVEVEPSVQVLGWKFAEVDKGDLIDTIAAVDKHLKAMEKWCEAARGTLKQTLPQPEVAGTETVTPGKQFEAHYVRSDRIALDQEKTKGYLEKQGVLADYLKTTPVLTLRIVPIAQTPGSTVQAPSA